MKGFALFRLFIVLLVISGAMCAASFQDAHTAWKYRDRPADKVTVEDIAAGKVQPGDWVQVTAADYSGDAVQLQVTHKSDSSSTTTQYEYHLLVSPNDPAMANWEKFRPQVQQLLAVDQNRLMQGNPQELQNYANSADTALEAAKNFHPTQYFALRINQGQVDPGSGLGNYTPPSLSQASPDQLQQAMQEVRRALSMASTMIGTSNTYTGIVSTVPKEVREKWTDLPGAPTLELNPERKPEQSSIYLLLGGIAGCIGTIVLFGFIFLRRRLGM